MTHEGRFQSSSTVVDNLYLCRLHSLEVTSATLHARLIWSRPDRANWTKLATWTSLLRPLLCFCSTLFELDANNNKDHDVDQNVHSKGWLNKNVDPLGSQVFSRAVAMWYYCVFISWGCCCLHVDRDSAIVNSALTEKWSPLGQSRQGHQAGSNELIVESLGELGTHDDDDDDDLDKNSQSGAASQQTNQSIGDIRSSLIEFSFWW